MYCQVSGANVRTSNYSGRVNAAGDEVEIGPWPRNGLNIYRRIRVYKKRPLARWLDIFENPTSGTITVPVVMNSNTRYSTARTTTNSGATSFGKKDWAFWTKPSSSNGIPTLHVVCSPGAKLRPTVQVSGSQIRTSYSLSVPAKKTVILCHFESQNRDPAAFGKLMKDFPLSSLLDDLPASVRAKIVNMRAGTLLGGVELQRSGVNDIVILTNGDPIYGIIENESFSIDALPGRTELKAAETVGMAAASGGRFQAVLVDGEILSGPVRGSGDKPAALKVQLRTGGRLLIPFDRIRQWSYRISESRPDTEAVSGAYVISQNGDRLVLGDKRITLKFRTVHGTIDLDCRHVASIVPISRRSRTGQAPDSAGPGAATRPAGTAVVVTHKATLFNGSRLSGSFADGEVKLSLKRDREVTVNPNRLAGLHFAREPSSNPLLSMVSTIGGDELFGRLTARSFQVATQYGNVAVSRTQLESIDFKRGSVDQTSFKLRNGTVLKGRLSDVTVGLEIAPGLSVKLQSRLLARVHCRMPLPPKAMIARIEQLVAQLGAESVLDRKAAVAALAGLGPDITSVLRRYLKCGDPEIRTGIWQVMIKLGTNGTRTPRPIQPYRHLYDSSIRL